MRAGHSRQKYSLATRVFRTACLLTELLVPAGQLISVVASPLRRRYVIDNEQVSCPVCKCLQDNHEETAGLRDSACQFPSKTSLEVDLISPLNKGFVVYNLGKGSPILSKARGQGLCTVYGLQSTRVYTQIRVSILPIQHTPNLCLYYQIV